MTLTKQHEGKTSRNYVWETGLHIRATRLHAETVYSKINVCKSRTQMITQTHKYKTKTAQVKPYLFFIGLISKFMKCINENTKV